MKKYRFLIHLSILVSCLGGVFYITQNCKPVNKSNLASGNGPETLELYMSEQSYKDYLCQQDVQMCNAVDALSKVLGGKWSFLEQDEMIKLLRSGVFEIENPMYAMRQVTMNQLRPSYLTLMESSKAAYDFQAQKYFGPSRVILPFLAGNKSSMARPIPASEYPDAHSLYAYTEEPTFVFGLKSTKAEGKIDKTVIMTLIPKALTKMATEAQRLQFASLDQSARWSSNPKDWVYAVIARESLDKFKDDAYIKLNVDLMNGRLLQTELEKQVRNMEIGTQQEIALGWAASIVLSGGVSGWLAYGLGVTTSVVSNISSANERGYGLAAVSIARDIASAGLFTKYKAIAVVASGVLAADYLLLTYAYIENNGGNFTTLDKLDFSIACVEIISALYVGTKLGLPLLKKFQKIDSIDGKPVQVARANKDTVVLSYAERVAVSEANIAADTAPVLPAAERLYSELFGDDYKGFLGTGKFKDSDIPTNSFAVPMTSKGRDPLNNPRMKQFIERGEYKTSDVFVYDGGETWVSKDGRTIIHETHGDIDIIIAPGRSKAKPGNEDFVTGRFNGGSFGSCDNAACHSVGINKAGYVFGDDRYHAQRVLGHAH